MDLRKIKKLIELLEGSALSEMEITEGENTIRLSRAAPHAMPAFASAAAPSPANQVETASAPATPAPPVPADEPPPGQVIKSPLVGTFFHSPSPKDPPYVAIGSVVGKGDTLCIIEAMKTFNQLEAEIAGTVTVIHKNNGDPVEYGEPLFVIKPQ